MKKGQSNKQKNRQFRKNPLEQDLESKKNSSNMLDQLFGQTGEVSRERQNERERAERQSESAHRGEFTVFNYQNYHETEIVKDKVKRLMEEIKQEIQAIKKENKDLEAETNKAEKELLKDLPEKPGIYHIRFFELILSILKRARAKVGEAKTWLAAMRTKKKKRGSLFLARSKKKGTKYSLSPELQSARSVM